MFSLALLLALEVTTSTPDALCPPLDETRDAIAARVGEIHGRYRVTFALMRGEDGSRSLKLDLLLDEQPVLQRELPLNRSGCDDAAQTIALVLERYFDAIERPSAAPPAPEQEPVPQTVEPRLSQLSPVPPGPARTSASAPSSRDRTLRASLRAGAGVLVARELGWAPSLSLQLRPAWLRPAPRAQLGWALALAPYATGRSQLVREQEIAERTLQIATWLPFELGLGTWSLWLGPWAQLRLQSARASALAEARPGYRSLPGLGGAAGFGWSPGAGLTLGVSGAVGAQLAGSAARFALRDADGNKVQVLVPENVFSQLGVELALNF